MGGNWSQAANAGLWYVNVNNSASNSNSNRGARLANGDQPEKLGVYGYLDSASFGAAVLTIVEDFKTNARLVLARGRKCGAFYIVYYGKNSR